MVGLFCFLFAFGLTQNSVTFLQNPIVNTLLERHVLSNKTVSITGFRINIFSQSGNHSRSGAMIAQNIFSERFPDMKSYVSFEEPYFRINVGNFRTQLEAAAALERLRAAYPQAFLVRDILNVKDLLGIIDVVEEEEKDENVF
jgi:hypothetical protein